MKRPYWNAVGFAGLLAMLSAGCATTAPPPGAPQAGFPARPAPGSTWVLAIRDSGSFGSANREVTFRSRGEETWQGRKVHANQATETTFLFDVATAGMVARVRGTEPLESWDPPLAWNWPMWVGKSWPLTYRYTNHERGQTFNVQAWVKVEAYEDIKVPAGTFKVFRVTYADEGTESVSWWSPDLHMSVKQRIQRTRTHFAGLGTRELELVSHDLKR